MEIIWQKEDVYYKVLDWNETIPGDVFVGNFKNENKDYKQQGIIIATCMGWILFSQDTIIETQIDRGIIVSGVPARIIEMVYALKEDEENRE